MAVVRRSAESGVVVVLVIFLVLAIAGFGCAIWFYQQLSIARKAITVDQAAFAETVHGKFKEYGWSMATQTPPELGVTYVRESYDAVAQKLAVAGEYEKVLRPLLGWESMEGLRTAMADSPAQKESQAQGKPAFSTLSGLLKYYEDAYGALSQQVVDLTNRNADLSNQLDEGKKELAQTRDGLQQDLNRASQNFRDELAKLREGYNDLQARHDRQAQEAAEWRQKYQKDVEELRKSVAQLEARLALEVKPPERVELVEAGEVLEVHAAYGFVMIQGGADRGFQENDEFVVYTKTLEGGNQKKGVIAVGKVYDLTSLATIKEKDRERSIVEGDLFVSVDAWNRFHEQTTAEARSGG